MSDADRFLFLALDTGSRGPHFASSIMSLSPSLHCSYESTSSNPSAYTFKRHSRRWTHMSLVLVVQLGCRWVGMRLCLRLSSQAQESKSSKHYASQQEIDCHGSLMACCGDQDLIDEVEKSPIRDIFGGSPA